MNNGGTRSRNQESLSTYWGSFVGRKDSLVRWFVLRLLSGFGGLTEWGLFYSQNDQWSNIVTASNAPYPSIPIISDNKYMGFSVASATVGRKNQIVQLSDLPEPRVQILKEFDTSLYLPNSINSGEEADIFSARGTTLAFVKVKIRRNPFSAKNLQFVHNSPDIVFFFIYGKIR